MLKTMNLLRAVIHAKPWIVVVAGLSCCATVGASADDLPGYCIERSDSPMPQVMGPGPGRGMNAEEQLEASFHRGTRRFVVKAEGKRLSLYAEDGTVVDEVRVRSPDKLRNLRLSQNGWLWIHGYELGYIGRISDGLPPKIIELKELTELKEQRCSRMSNWLGGCKSSRSQYSDLLQSVLMTGYAVGSDEPITVETRNGQSRVLGFSPVENGYVSQHAALGGLVFSNADNGLNFYDGHVLVPITLAGDASRYRAIAWASHASGRVFASRSEFPDTERVYLAELLPGGQVNRIKMPERLPGWWFPLFFDFPPDRVAFGFTRYSLGVVVNGQWHSLAVTGEDDYIHGPAHLGKGPDGHIHFVVRKKGDNGSSIDGPSSVHFVLRRMVGADTCARRLQLQAPLQLKRDL